MGTVTSLIVAAVIGVALATGTVATVLKVSVQTPENTTQVEQKLIQYGQR